jgi:hypothetical protein
MTGRVEHLDPPNSEIIGRRHLDNGSSGNPGPLTSRRAAS